MELAEGKPNLRWVASRNSEGRGDAPVHQIRPHIYPRFISPSARRAMARALMGHDPSPATN